MYYDIVATHSKTKHPQKKDFNLHIHDNCEIFLFLHGNADYFVEGTVYPLHKGDIIINRHSEAHHLILYSDAEYERKCINFPISIISDLDTDKRIYNMFYNRPIGKYNHFSSKHFPERMWDYFISKICETNTQERKLIYLYALLDEMAEDFKTVKSTSKNIKNNKTADIIQYIDNHLFENISILTICERFYISQPHLNRLFKSATGSTVWNYITTKRLLYAKELLKCGEHPTKVYEECGYTNYVSFYKAYKKFYNISPLDSKNNR